MPAPRPIDAGAQLLVEGGDPAGFFGALREHLTIPERDLQIQNFGGVNQLRVFLSTLTKMSGFSSVRSVGVVRDAEQNPDGAFESVQGALEHAGLTAPDAPERRIEGPPAVNVLILPGANRPGMLETLLCDTFAEEPVRPCIDAFFTCVEAKLREAPHRPEKARARALSRIDALMEPTSAARRAGGPR